MQDTLFYSSLLIASVLLSQVEVPDLQQFRELSATVILGVLFWYTLTRVNAGIAKLTEVIGELKESIHGLASESRKEKE